MSLQRVLRTELLKSSNRCVCVCVEGGGGGGSGRFVHRKASFCILYNVGQCTCI